MNRQLTYFEHILIVAVCILTVALLCSCATTPRPHKDYYVESFTIRVMSAREINKRWESMGGEGYVLGLCDPTRRVIYVVRETRSSELPDFDTLGHELWHLVDKGFHDEGVSVLPTVNEKEEK